MNYSIRNTFATGSERKQKRRSSRLCLCYVALLPLLLYNGGKKHMGCNREFLSAVAGQPHTFGSPFPGAGSKSKEAFSVYFTPTKQQTVVNIENISGCLQGSVF